MPRAKDLDTVAPDDIVSPIPARPVPKTKKTKKHQKSAVGASLAGAHTPKNSVSGSYRQKVYELIKGTTAHSLSAFLARPKVFTFQNRDDDEEILLVLRRHWFTNISWILTAILMALAPLIFPLIPFLNFFPARYQLILLLFWYLITFAMAFEKFLSWYFNVCIITEERVVDIDFYNLLYKKESEAKISMIQDVTVSQGGVSQTVFNYGSVLIQTAGEIPTIEFQLVPDPGLVLKVLQQMRGEEEQEALEGRTK